jgi:hypothetical protein
MQNRYEANRSFDPASLPGLSSKARDAVTAAFEAMSTWRDEAADNSEKNSRKVLEKMAAAAAAMGWPEQIVEAARAQIQGITDMQIKTMDHVMDAWEHQLKQPNPMTASPSAMLSRMKYWPGLGAAGGWQGAGPTAAMNPAQFWMNVAEQWQKSWADSMAMWTNAPRSST